MFEDAEIGIPCPKCGHKNQKSIAWIKANDKFTCEGCGSSVTVQAEELLVGLNEVDKSIAELRKKISGIGKKR